MPEVFRYERQRTIPGEGPNAFGNVAAAGAQGAAIAQAGQALGKVGESLAVRARELKDQEEESTYLLRTAKMGDDARAYLGDALQLQGHDALDSQKRGEEFRKQIESNALEGITSNALKNRLMRAAFTTSGHVMDKLAMHEAGQRRAITDSALKATLVDQKKNVYEGLSSLSDALQNYDNSLAALHSLKGIGSLEVENQSVTARRELTLAYFDGLERRDPRAFAKAIRDREHVAHLKEDDIRKLDDRGQRASYFNLIQQGMQNPEQLYRETAQSLGISPERLNAAPSGAAPSFPKYDGIIEAEAQKNGVPADLVKRVINQESRGNANAVSPKGAKGLMQLMPGTASDLGVTDSADPNQNIAGGTRYLALQLQAFGGDQRKALAAYNAGPKTVSSLIKKYGDNWETRLPAETKDYLKQILGDGKTADQNENLTGYDVHGAGADSLGNVQVQDTKTGNVELDSLNPQTKIALFTHLQSEVRRRQSERSEALKIQQSADDERYKTGLVAYEEMLKKGIPAPDGLAGALRIHAAKKGIPELQKISELESRYDARYLWDKRKDDPLFGYGLPEISQADLLNPQELARKKELYRVAGRQTAAYFKDDYQAIVPAKTAELIGEMFLAKGPESAHKELAPLLSGYNPGDYARLGAQIAKKDPLAASIVAAALSGDVKTAQSIYNGSKLMTANRKEGSGLLKIFKEEDAADYFRSQLGDAVMSNIDASGAKYAAFRAVLLDLMAKNGIHDGSFKTSLAEQSFKSVIGDVERLNGSKTIIAPGLNSGQMQADIRAITAKDAAALGGVFFEAVPAKGSTAATLKRMPDEYAARMMRDARFVYLGAGQYAMDVPNQNFVLDSESNLAAVGDYDPNMTGTNTYGTYRGSGPHGSWIRLVNAEGKPLKVVFNAR